jgi:hypothetical protein
MNSKEKKNHKNQQYFKRKTSSILQFYFPYLTWLAINLKINRVSITPILSYCNKLLVILNTRGKTFCIKYNKENRLNFLNFIFSLNEEFETMGTSGKPSKSLRPLIQMIIKSKSYNLIRLFLSGLYITRGLRTKEGPSFESIEGKPSNEESYFDKYSKDMFFFLKNKLGVNPKHMGKPTKSIRWKSYHMSSKSGPIGHALWSSVLELYIMPHHLALAIYSLGGPKLETNMHYLRLLFTLIPEFFLSHLPRKRSGSLRKISVINDKEGKVREIAIGDYWSQASLKPLHNYLYKLLLRIHQDCTHNQSKIIGKLTPKVGSSFHSIDLSSATDRFPIHVEYLLVKTLFGRRIANCWKHIMVHIPFDYHGTKISYRTGNPMGMYSSWATFAVCHHFLVYLACKKARVKWEKCPYMLLGDDIVIADDDVALAYKEILILWDIPFSPEKTHTSLHGYEFAKQIVIHGKNVSPLPLAALYERRNSPLETVGILLSELWSKDWKLPIEPVLESYFLKLAKWNKPRFIAFKPKLKLATSLLSYFKGLSDLGTAIMEYVTDWTKKEWKVNPVHQKAFARWLAVKTVHKLFYESRDRVTDYENKQPLGELAEHMLILITSLDIGVDPFEFIKSVPFLQIYGRAEETFIRLQGDLNDKGLGGSRDLRRFIGKVDIPLSDRDFYVRHRDVLLIRALRSSRIIEGLIQTTPQVVSWNGRLDFTLPWYKYTKFEGDLLPDRRMPT